MVNAYVVASLLLGLTIAFYLLGFQSTLMTNMDKYGGLNSESVFASFSDYITSSEGILGLSFVVLAGIFIGLGAGSVAIVFALGLILMQVMVFPTSMITESALPPEFTLIISIILNFLMFITIIAFLRE